MKLRISAELGVDPLHVVERDEQRPLPSERAHDRDQCEPEHACLGRRPIGLAEQQGDLERSSLYRRQRAALRPASPRRGRRPLRMRSGSRRAARTRRKHTEPLSRAVRSPSCQSAVLPIPASPSISNACPPAGTASTNRASAASSSRLSMIRSVVVSPSIDSGRRRRVRITTSRHGDCRPAAH